MPRYRNALYQQPSHRLTRRRARQPDSLLVKHHALFHSLARYATTSANSTATSTSAAVSRARAAAAAKHRTARLKQRYSVGRIWSYVWPVPFSEHAPSESQPEKRVDELVTKVVAACFEQEYEKFRSPESGKRHAITDSHRSRIVVDPVEVEASAAAARALVHTALKRFVLAAKKGSFATPTTKPTCATLAHTIPSEAAPDAAARTESIDSTERMDPELDEAELDDEIGQPEYALGWEQLLDFFQSTGGNSASAQWRNWHLLAAIAKTRQRCNHLFPTESF